MVMGDLNLLSFLIFIAGGFAASVITALAGFAFGIIAAGPWLHVLTPSQTTALIVAYGLLVQGYSVWKLRAAIKIGRLLPFLVGGAIGSALGVQLLSWVGATHLRLGVGAVLIAYARMVCCVRICRVLLARADSSTLLSAFSAACSAAPPDWPELWS
jgi:uncharacterized protein